jgi:dephospho-CoA kinase
MPIVALTGGVAAGKSTVTDVLEQCGAAVVDADLLAREVVKPGSQALISIAKRFGSGVLDEAGALNRVALGSLIFGDNQAREALESIVHPLVRELSRQKLRAIQTEEPQRVLIYAIPLLAESRSPEEFDLVVSVEAPASVRAQRLVEHRGFSAEDAQARVSAQASEAERRQISDVVLDSSQSLERTRELATLLFRALSQCWPDRLSEVPSVYQALQS